MTITIKSIKDHFWFYDHLRKCRKEMERYGELRITSERQIGYVTACKAVHDGSIPSSESMIDEDIK